MRLLSFVYRFATNFVFLATVYLSLNYIEKYNNRAVLAIAILVYAGLRAASALRSFYFFQRIERLEVEARGDRPPASGRAGGGGGASAVSGAR